METNIVDWPAGTTGTLHNGAKVTRLPHYLMVDGQSLAESMAQKLGLTGTKDPEPTEIVLWNTGDRGDEWVRLAGGAIHRADFTIFSTREIAGIKDIKRDTLDLSKLRSILNS